MGVLRGPAMDGIAACAASVSEGTVFADLPKELFAGGQHVGVPAMYPKRNKKDKRVFALIGGGCAALAAAEVLRQEGFGGRIVMITAEPHLPYDRVVLSKDVSKTAASVRLRDEAFFETHAIEVLRETTVQRLDAQAQEITFAAAGLDETQSLKYDCVLVASGSSPRKLACPGSTLKNVFTLRTPEDAAAISQVARIRQKMVIVGGSFIAMEMATTLKARGCDVTIVALEAVPFEHVLGRKVGESFARLLQKRNIEWIGGSQVRQFIQGKTGVNGVELEDGEVLPADGIVLGVGALPNTGFVEGVPLAKDGAIAVGGTLASEAAPTLFAAGDVCSFPCAVTGKHARIEHWNVAVEQGQVAARNMLGAGAAFDAVPYFCSQVLGNELRFVGHPPSRLDRVILEGDASGMEFVAYYFEELQVRAVATVNRDHVAVACAEHMRLGTMPRLPQLIHGTVNGDVLLQRLKLV
eukprot:NODE_390_length_1605_cov_132.142581.p2 GENE.NODE_390_length_1605_cov_132.142581~~NODE_390_length_1605_cov_132.142581.p2  ORF type:complete len:467 (-),score=153.66 NODE_390_length_1605_cov_132.142581:187-1587(-)